MEGVRLVFSMLLLSVVAFAAGFWWREGEAREKKTVRTAVAIGVTEATVAGTREGEVREEVVRPDTKEIRRIFRDHPQDGQEWKAEREICRVLMAFGAEDFRDFAKGTGPLFESVLEAHDYQTFREHSDLLPPPFYRALAMRWVRLDRAGALAWAKSADPLRPFSGSEMEGDRLDLGVKVAVPIRAGLERELAEEILSDAEWRGRSESLARALHEVARRRPEEARVWLARLSPGEATSALRERTEAGLAEGDPESFLGPLLAKQEPLDKEGTIHSEDDSGESMAIREAAARGAAMLRRLARSAVNQKLKLQLALRLADDAPADGAEILATMYDAHAPGDRGVRPDELRTAAASFAIDDRAAAKRWAESLTGPARAEALKGVAYGWATLDPQAALAWAVEQKEDGESLAAPTDEATRKAEPEDSGAHTLQIAAAQAWLRMDQAAAQAWVDARPAGPLRDRLVLTAGRWSWRNDPKLAREAASIFQRMPKEQMDSDMLGDVAMGLVANGYPEATAWVLALPDVPGKEWALGSTLGIWSSEKPAAVLAWMRGLPPGRVADLARVKWVELQPEWTWQGNEQLIEEIADPHLKMEAAERFYLRWRKLNAPDARRWLAELPGLDPAYQRTVLEDE
jgi:hypothetical protein